MTGSAADRDGFLDSLRFIAAFVVCLYHFLETQPRTPAIDAFLASGANTAAVVVFFFISGYVMPITVRRGFDPGTFAVRRVFRLLPIYFAALVLIGAGGATGLIAQWRYMWQSDAATWIANLLIVQDFVGARPFLGVSWTLAIEIIWYMLFAVALVALRHRAALTLGIAAPVALLLLAAASLATGHRIPLGRPAMIYAAVLGWQLYDFSAGAASRRATLGWIALFLIVTAVTNIVAFGIFRHEHVHIGPVLLSWSIATAAFAGVILSPRLRHAPLLATGVLPTLGAMTYSVYLLHPIALALTRQYLGSAGMAVQFGTYAATTAMLALIGYRCIELPAIGLGKRVADATRRQALA